MKLGPWFSCMSFDKTIRSLYASVLHHKNENIPSHFSPLEARVKINLTENAKVMKSKVPETSWTERQGSRDLEEQTCLRNGGVADGFTLQCKLTPLWHLQTSDTCWGEVLLLRLWWMESTPLPWLGPCCSPLRTPQVSPQWQIFQIFLTAENAGVAPTAPTLNHAKSLLLKQFPHTRRHRGIFVTCTAVAIRKSMFANISTQ